MQNYNPSNTCPTTGCSEITVPVEGQRTPCDRHAALWEQALALLPADRELNAWTIATAQLQTKHTLGLFDAICARVGYTAGLHLWDEACSLRASWEKASRRALAAALVQIGIPMQGTTEMAWVRTTAH